MKIAVVGLGYVGLPLSIQFARSCTEVIGIEVDPQKVKQRVKVYQACKCRWD